MHTVEFYYYQRNMYAEATDVELRGYLFMICIDDDVRRYSYID